jgi:hypothetical protein
MDIKNVVTIGALVIAGLALVLGRGSAPQTVQAGGGSVGGITLGDGPTFNIQSGSTNGRYTGGGGYPPFNSCGCGRANNGLNVVANISPVYGSAITLPFGIKAQPGPAVLPVDLIGNGSFA